MNRSIVIISCSKQIENSLQVFLICDRRKKKGKHPTQLVPVTLCAAACVFLIKHTVEASHFIISSSFRSSPPPLVSLGLGLQSMRFSPRVMSHMRLGGQKCFICKTESTPPTPRPPSSYITHTEKVTHEQMIQFVADHLLS